MAGYTAHPLDGVINVQIKNIFKNLEFYHVESFKEVEQHHDQNTQNQRGKYWHCT